MFAAATSPGAPPRPQAIGDGKHAAEKIAAYLGLTTSINQGAEIELPPRGEKKTNYKSAGKMRNLPAKERIHSEDEVALGLTEEMLQAEAARCYRCSGKASVDTERASTAACAGSTATTAQWSSKCSTSPSSTP